MRNKQNASIPIVLSAHYWAVQYGVRRFSFAFSILGIFYLFVSPLWCELPHKTQNSSEGGDIAQSFHRFKALK